MDLTAAMDLTQDEALSRRDLRDELQVFARETLRNELQAFANQVKRHLHDELMDLVQSIPEKAMGEAQSMHTQSLPDRLTAIERSPSKPCSPNGAHTKGVTMAQPVSPSGPSAGGTSPGGTSAQVYFSETAQSVNDNRLRHSVCSAMPESFSDGTESQLSAGISRFDDDDDDFMGLRGYVVTAEMNFLQDQETKRNSITNGIGRESKLMHSMHSKHNRQSLAKFKRGLTSELGTASKKPMKLRSQSTGLANRKFASTRSDASHHSNQGCAHAVGDIGVASAPLGALSRNRHPSAIGDINWAMPRPPSEMVTEPPPPPDEAGLAPLPVGVVHVRRESKQSNGSQQSVEHPGMVSDSDHNTESAEYQVVYRSSIQSDQSENTRSSEPEARQESRSWRSLHKHSIQQDQQVSFQNDELQKSKPCMTVARRSQQEPVVDEPNDDDDSDQEDNTFMPTMSLAHRLQQARMSCAYRTSAACLAHPCFDYITTLLILINAVTIGIQADWSARNVSEDVPRVFGLLETFFCVCFSIELLIRIFVYRSQFFTMATWKWNVFDSIVVGVQIVEELFAIIWKVTLDSSDNGLPTNIAALRVMRILRVIRIVRLVRVLRLINELRTLVHSIVGTLKSLLWTCVLIFLMIYIVGVYLTQVVTDARVDFQDTDDTLETVANQSLSLYYGTLTLSLLSLYQSISGGIDWNDTVTPLTDHIHPLLGLFFAAYIAFMLLAVFNVVTGVFVETALVSAKEDKDVYMVNHLKNIFMTSDQNDDRTIDWREFESQLQNRELKEYFKAIDVDISEAHHVFRLLDPTDSGNIDAEEFLSGCLRLKGPAKSLDMNILLRETKRMGQMYKAHAHWVERHLAPLKEVVPAVRSMQSIMSSQLETLRQVPVNGGLDSEKEEWLV